MSTSFPTPRSSASGNGSPVARAQIFISYRRDDSAGYARAVYDELARHFGADRVFIDVDDIPAGQSFADVIRQAVGGSEALVVLMGKRWLGERDGAPPRIADPGDFVAIEVAAGLAKGMSVIPLLLDGTPMPAAAQLPAPLRPLVERNALELGNTRFASDMDRLVRALREVLGESSPVLPAPSIAPRGPAASRALWLGGAAVAVAALAVLGWRAATRDGASSESGAATAPAASASVRPAVDGAWQAEVVYDWPNARHVERFVLGGAGDSLNGSASFLGVPRGILDGSVAPGALRFVTRTRETGADGSLEAVHRYTGRIVGDEIRFVMQTEGGSSPHVPVEFTARRTEPAPLSK